MFAPRCSSQARLALRADARRRFQPRLAIAARLHARHSAASSRWAANEFPVYTGPHSDAKERIKQTIDIVDLVGSYLSLRRQGRNYVALCPWHDDSRPSLQINPDRQTFKCWVCNLGGDIFSFVMQKEGVEFREALEMLAEKAGITLDEPRRNFPSSRSGSSFSEDELDYSDGFEPAEYGTLPGESGGSSRSSNTGNGPAPDKPAMFRAMAWAVKLFHECLLHDELAAPARDYLESRGISADMVKLYQLGFAPDDWNWLVNRAAGKASALRTLERVGLLGKSQRGTFYDRFKGRVLFPIRDMQGRPIALGGRVMPGMAKATDPDARPPAKYINSPETPLFSKNREFYGLDLAREAIAKTGRVLVMEGYTDCIMARQFGFENVVAVLGTALGENHVRRLRFADDCRVILVLDGDDAGRKRANEVLELFVAAQVDLRILTLPDDLDPCDFLQQRGPEAFAALLDEAVDALEHKMQIVTTGIDPNDTHRANQALEDVLGTLAVAPHASAEVTSESRVRQQQLLSRLARRFRVSEEELRLRIATLRRKPQRAASAAASQAITTPAPPAALAAWERELLELFLICPGAVEQAASVVRVEQLGALAARQIFVVCRELAERGRTPTLDRLLNEFEDPAMQSLLVELDERGRERGLNSAEIRLVRLLENIHNQEEQRHHREQLAAIDERRIDEQEQMQVLLRMMEQKRNRQGISKPTDG
jgi:DNA primase